MSHVKKLTSSKYQARHRGSDGREHARNFGSQAGCGLLARRGDSTCTSGVVDPPEGRPRHPRGVVCHLPRRPAREALDPGVLRVACPSCILPVLGKYPLAELRLAQVDTWVAAMREVGLSPSRIVVGVGPRWTKRSSLDFHSRTLPPPGERKVCWTWRSCESDGVRETGHDGRGGVNWVVV
jgi:hypothetical protein